MTTRKRIALFEINLDRKNGVYKAGDTIHGDVVAEVTEALKIRGIRLRFRGKAFVKWCETEQSGIGITRISSKQDFSAAENYFDTTVMLTGTMQITKFKQWLLSKKVAEATYSILEREGFHDLEMFSLLKPDSVLRLSITLLSQAVLVQGLAERCSKEGPRRFEDEIYDDVMNDAGQYVELNQT